MGKTTAKIITGLLHPLLMTSFGLLIMFNSGSAMSVLPSRFKSISMIFVLLFTCILPVLFVLLLSLMRIVSSHELKERKERMLPMAITTLLHLITFYILREAIQQLTRGHIVYLFCPAAALFVAMILNNYIKVSLHMVAIGGLLALELMLIIIYAAPIQHLFIITLFASGLLGTSQLVLEENKPVDIYSGFGAGFVTYSLIMLFALA